MFVTTLFFLFDYLRYIAGIGWTTWKKRWFILTRASLVFFRTDPVRYIEVLTALLCISYSLVKLL
jgi:hypothetical protein